MIKMLIYGHSLFRLTTFTSVFLLFNSNTTFLLSYSVMPKNCCKFSLFTPIKTASSANIKLFMLCSPTLIPGHPFVFHIIISLYREKRSGESTHPCLRPHFIFFKLADFPIESHCAVCYQDMFFITPDVFHLSTVLVV